MTDKPLHTTLHARYDWLDQARGLIVLMLLISMATAEYAGEMVLGEPVLGPPMLNHGYDYYDGEPAIITFVDSGQALFVFIMGFVGYTAFTSRLRKRGTRSAFFYAMRRVLLLYALAALDAIGLNMLEGGDPNWPDFFYNGTFAAIALGSLAAFVSIALIPKADSRILLGMALVAAHTVLYEYPMFDHRAWFDDVMGYARFPFGALGMCTVAIMGTCFGQWLLIEPDAPGVGFQQRIAPASMIALVASYCIAWIQPAEHHDATAALQLMAVSVGGFTLMIFYAYSLAGFRFPLLSSFGRNLLLMFAVGGLFVGIYWNFVPREYLAQSPFMALVLAGIVPIAVMGALAVFLDKRGVMVRA